MTAIAYIGLGSNLSDPIAQVNNALQALETLHDSKLLNASALYRSAPMGPQDQNDYINAVAELSTSLAPIDLLDALQAIENEQGRVRIGERWGPRTLDLDILLYNNKIIEHPRLTVPHYGMKERSFVLIPLAEIAPELVLPDNTPLSDLVANLAKDDIERIT
ncbi:2-amino-4-hydroxy-6-hydroxymethyldihydropteridine diphosphokinase [Pleionea sp. CnH1-48]|uniref:2-amino-4-hydroxy-6- hydroxymethyldihydropteridine diphosphokinase n=1 Tax=Pleionea sp. CnH1-48 TaxID=2954494 RepID=UPI0020978668|nr:2-amino-4-hydroxy-6-hydroxymethyldihydropteridine diphosphokinase [Pleionea sp. CnH1-48]MCO7227355.1 2-amino-4-hydroxy-6-hydroxymethyldihydropteridine diphosphokinase [Pleionea sp. CnH1-48]